jgi:hypothetical protein
MALIFMAHDLVGAVVATELGIAAASYQLGPGNESEIRRGRPAWTRAPSWKTLILQASLSIAGGRE